LSGSSVIVQEDAAYAVEVILEGVRILQPLGGGAAWVVGEIPNGAIDGANSIFTALYSFDPATLAVYLNGVRQQVGTGNDYTISGSSVILTTPPLSGEKVLFDYQRS
jgi:hypothetical protein